MGQSSRHYVGVVVMMTGAGVAVQVVVTAAAVSKVPTVQTADLDRLCSFDCRRRTVVSGRVLSSLLIMNLGREGRLVCSVDWMAPSTVDCVSYISLCGYMTLQVEAGRVKECMMVRDKLLFQVVLEWSSDAMGVVMPWGQ